MAESRVIMNRPNSSSPPPNCAICLGTCTNKCFSDSCMHQFCFKCLLEWSKIKAECPLCKQPFRTIIHNVKSNEEYDEHVVEIDTPDEIHIIDNEEYLFLPLGVSIAPQLAAMQSTRHQFHFRTTFTVDTRGEHAIQQMLLTHPLTNGGQISIGGYAPGRSMYHRRRRDNTSASFRRSIYTRNMWVNAPPDVTGRYRDVSPGFFRDCPGARTRLVPWLNRELNALLYENTQLVMRLVDIIMDHLLRHHICSRTFRTLLFEYLDNLTDHFVHEFYNFMRSPFDMIGYDRHVVYSERPHSPTPYIDVSDNDEDSDVILVSATDPQEPVVIDLVNTDSDEPILVSQVESALPRPIPEENPEQENRATVLPLKLRLKQHKRRLSREEKKLKQKKRPRYRRNSSSSSSSSSCDSSKDCYKRYKKRKRQKKLTKKKPHSSSSEIEQAASNSSSDSDDNIPLSAFAGRKRHLKKLKKSASRMHKNARRTSAPVKFARDISIKELERVPRLVDYANLPSCSRYFSDSDSSYNAANSDGSSRKENDTARELRSSHQRNRETSTAVNGPTCSKYTSPYSSSHEGSSSMNLNRTRSRGGASNDEPPYSLRHMVKSEVREVRPEQQNGGPSGTGHSNKRLKNILIKKEESGNTWSWYSYPCNYDSDSSD